MIPKSASINSLRILLWDLDGTLVRGARYGIFKDYTGPMLEAVFGTAGCLPDMIVSGMTDLQIVEEALRGEGITREHITDRKDELLRCYITEMKLATGHGNHIIMAMPGAREVLKAVDEHPRYLSALLTGNIQPAAQLKVEITGLAEFFRLPGAFGDESFDRRDLPAIAARRINEHLGLNLSPDQFIVIGDTPKRYCVRSSFRRPRGGRRHGAHSFGRRTESVWTRRAVAGSSGFRAFAPNVGRIMSLQGR